MAKIENYQEKYEEIQNGLGMNGWNESSDIENIFPSHFKMNILQTDLIFEIIKALQIIAKQNIENKKEIKELTLKIKDLLGEPIELQTGENNNDTSSGENN